MSDDGQARRRDDYLLKVDNPLVVPVDKKVRIITTANDVIHSWACRRSASSRTRFPASCATPGSAPTRPATSTASAPSCAARSTPTCRSTSRCCRQDDYTRLGRRQAEGRWPRWPTTRTRSGRSTSWKHAAPRSTPPTAPPATRPTARAPGPIKPLDGSTVVHRPDKPSRSRGAATAQNNGAMPAWKQLVRHRHRGGHHLHQEPLGQQDRADRAAGRSCRRRASKPAANRARIEGNPHERSPRTIRATTPATTMTITRHRTAGAAGSTRPTTRTSARCTCCSRSRCSWSAACWRW